MTRIVLLSSLLLVLFSASAPSQVLYSLESPFEEQNGFFGISVSSAGNVNSDWYDDIIVGAPSETYIYPGAGTAYIFKGATGQLYRTLVSPNAKTDGHFASSVSGAGDVNSDGFDDVIVGAPSEDDVYTSAGRAYVFNGQTGDLIHSLYSLNEEQGGYFGISVSGVGDVDSDGYDDVIIGAELEGPGSSLFGAGRAYVFSGQTGNIIYTLAAPVENDSLWFGCSVSGAGDVNSDGYDDVIVGAEGANNVYTHSGRAYIFSGQTGLVLHTLVSPFEESYGWFGNEVSGAGDVNSDGYDDVIVGAFNETYFLGGAGTAYVFSGQTGGLLHILVSPSPEYLGRFGESVSGAGDVNLDGYKDVIVGAGNEDPDDSPDGAGRAYVFCGQTGALLHTLISPNEEVNGWFGGSVSGAGDVNSSGFAEVVVGAYLEDPESAPPGAGRAYVYAITPEPMELSGDLDGPDLVLQWTPCMGDVIGYWLYGAPENVYFEPGIPPPHEHIQAALPPSILEWRMPNGIGDPDWNWTYLVIAVDMTEAAMLGISNRFGEQDFAYDIP